LTNYTSEATSNTSDVNLNSAHYISEKDPVIYNYTYHTSNGEVIPVQSTT